MENNEQLQMMATLSLQIFKLNGLFLAERARLTDNIDMTPSRWRVLGALSRAGCPLTVPEIAREMGQTRQSIQRLADVMTGDGFVEYVDNPAHARSRNVRLTTLGEQTFTSLAERQLSAQALIAKGLNLEDMKQASRVLAQIISNLDLPVVAD